MTFVVLMLLLLEEARLRSSLVLLGGWKMMKSEAEVRNWIVYVRRKNCLKNIKY